MITQKENWRRCQWWCHFMTIAISHSENVSLFHRTHIFRVASVSRYNNCMLNSGRTKRSTFTFSLLAAAVLRGRQMNRLNSWLPWHSTTVCHLTTTTESSSSNWDTVQAQKFLSMLRCVKKSFLHSNRSLDQQFSNCTSTLLKPLSWLPIFEIFVKSLFQIVKCGE